MTRYLIDTDWIIHYLHGHSQIVERLTGLAGESLGVSVISLAELFEGIYCSTDPTGNESALNDFLSGCTIVGIDGETCRLFGKQRGQLRAAGKVVGDFDLMIGCTALRYDLPLFSNNKRHFEMIENLQIISL